jgi:deoxyribodipyrimidine photolyase-related protein
MKLALVLGDQLWLGNPALAAFDRAEDLVLMVEAAEESNHVWSAKPRTALFLAAMRHFARTLAEDGYRVRYLRLGEHAHGMLDAAWRAVIAELRPSEVHVCEPGDWRVEQMLHALAAAGPIPLTVHPDPHFLVSRAEFARWAGGPTPAGKRPKKLLMERFYRHMRVKTNVLVTAAGEPVGGVWNLDHENRETFGRTGPGMLSSPPRFEPDAITRSALEDTERFFSDHPGSLAQFAWPVTRAQALEALESFVRDRLPDFGRFQDAMWTDAPFLHHSLLSAALNLHLLDPREVIAAVVDAFEAGHCALASAEGFIRQILGWREFMRGVYWLDMPALASANHFGHELPLPRWYWTGATQMNCLRQAIGQTLAHGYAHHIQRLMVTGNFALVAGIRPEEVAAWYLAVYVDAIEWVEHPNTLGMALYANGGRFTSKPYAASGAYVKRMSNYCAGCRYRPEEKTGARACPITVFYWDFMARNRAELGVNPRAHMVLANLDRMGPDAVAAIGAQAEVLRAQIDAL